MLLITENTFCHLWERRTTKCLALWWSCSVYLKYVVCSALVLFFGGQTFTQTVFTTWLKHTIKWNTEVCIIIYNNSTILPKCRCACKCTHCLCFIQALFEAGENRVGTVCSVLIDVLTSKSEAQLCKSKLKVRRNIYDRIQMLHTWLFFTESWLYIFRH